MAPPQLLRVKLRHYGSIEIFHSADSGVEAGDLCIVNYDRGQDFGRCIEVFDDDSVDIPDKQSAVRVCQSGDIERIEKNMQDAKNCIPICNEEVAAHQLEMKLIESEYTFDRRKLVFYFSADHRVDFRELVRAVAHRVKARIELRQIGIRDETKIVGGVGCCGRKTCCSSWIDEFDSVNIRMAKVQQIQLHPTKLSGVCGRLKCCLAYEYKSYCQLEKKLPKKGQRVRTPDGTGDVKDVSLLSQAVLVSFDDHRLAWFQGKNVTAVSRSKSRARAKAKKRKTRRRSNKEKSQDKK